MIFSLTWLKSQNPPDDWGRMHILAVYFIFSRPWTVPDICWRPTSAAKNNSPLFIVICGPLVNHPGKKQKNKKHPPTAPHVCHIQKSYFGSLLIPWLVGFAVDDVFMARSTNQRTAASIPALIHLTLLSALAVHVGVPHMCLALWVCVFLQRFIAGQPSICLSPCSL